MPHNRTILNVSGILYGGYPFINWFKQQVERIYENSASFPTSLDANGYPVSGTLGLNISGGGLWTPAAYNGPWVLKWTGKLGNGVTAAFQFYGSMGAFSVSSGGAFVTASGAVLSVSGTNGRVVFTTGGSTTPAHDGNNWQWRFLSGGSFDGTLSNMILCRASDETALDGGEYFLPEFIAELEELNPGTLRFLDWNGINNVAQTKFSYRMPVSAFAWYDFAWPAGAWGGTTGGSSTAYTCSAGSDTPGSHTDMEVIQVFFHAANTTNNPTLNVGGRGAKTILNRTCNTLTIGGVSDVSIQAGCLRTLVFDAAIDKWIMHAGDGDGNPGGYKPGIPVEVQIALCNRLNCDFWFQFNQYQFASADITSYVELIRDNLNSGLKCYLEAGNEVWNFGFNAIFWMIARSATATYNFVDGGKWSYAGLQVAQMAPIARAAWSPRTSSELKIVLSYQMWWGVDILFGQQYYNWQGPELGAFGHSTAPNRPLDLCDCLSYANYINGRQVLPNYNGGLTGLITEFTDAADDYDSGNPTLMANALDFVDTDLRVGVGSSATDGDYTFPIASSITVYTNQLNARNTLGSSKPFALYEGGFQIVPPNATQCSDMGVPGYATKFANLITAYKNSQAYYDIQTYFLQSFVDVAGTDAIPCQYYFTFGTASQWSLYPTNFIDSTPYQSFDAIVDWNGGAVAPDEPSDAWTGRRKYIVFQM